MLHNLLCGSHMPARERPFATVPNGGCEDCFRADGKIDGRVRGGRAIFPIAAAVVAISVTLDETYRKRSLHGGFSRTRGEKLERAEHVFVRLFADIIFNKDLRGSTQKVVGTDLVITGAKDELGIRILV